MRRNALGLFVVSLAAGMIAMVGCGKESAEVTPAASAAASAAPMCRPGSHAEGTLCVPDPPAPSEAASAEPSPSASSSASAPLAHCPDLSNPDGTLAFDWQKELAVEAPIAAKLRALATAATETKAMANEIESELKVACTRLAIALGAKGPFAGADVTCQAASDGLRTARERLGPAARVSVVTHAPICPEAQADVEACSKLCSTTEPTDAPKCVGAQVGKCAAGCDGVCEHRAAAKCEGACLGKCDNGFSGKCAGTCKGKCDGKDAKKDGACAGKCEGSCEGTGGSGECKGLCEGGCRGKALSCTGVCAGKCASPLTELACAGTLQPANVGPECIAACATRAARKATCTMATVNVTVSGAKDVAAGTAYEGAIEHALPLLLRIERRLRGRVEGIAKNQKLVGDGLKEVSQRGPGANASACLIAVEKTVTEGTATLNADYRATSLVVTLAQH